MPDIFLYQGEASPNDIKCSDPTVVRSGAVVVSLRGRPGKRRLWKRREREEVRVEPARDVVRVLERPPAVTAAPAFDEDEMIALLLAA